MTIKHADDDEAEPESFDDTEESLVPRPPVVTIMGHVDHGKTTLLDAIRKTAVVDTEAGGITQHIGAYQTEVDGRKLTFLDTPGHEAFTAMRARGAKVTDIAVLVVAADDSVMPQTLESISHARAADVPIVVAVNKIDLPGANPDRVLADLATQGLQPEEWGGTTQVAKVSAKQGENLDELLEKILLVADLELDLRANPAVEASGPIIESRLDVGRGTVTTMLVHRGTLKVGDAIVAGDAWGRVRALYDYRGEKIDAAGPGDPVEILGFDHSAARPVSSPAWSRTTAAPASSRSSAASASGANRLRSRPAAASRSRSCSSSSRRAASPTSTSSSRPTCRARSRRSSASSRRSTTPRFASTSSTRVSAGSPRTTSTSPPPRAGWSSASTSARRARPRQLAERQGIEIRQYRVIYELTQQIEQALVGMLSPVETEAVIGEVEVRALFRASRVGTIAGCMVTSGIVRRGSRVRIFRDGARIHETSVAQLKRFKDDAREVVGGLRVRDPARGLQRPARRRHLRGLRDS